MNTPHLARVQRLAAHAKWVFVATIPPTLIVALSALPLSLIHLNFVGAQLFVLYYFNGRTAAAGRNRASQELETGASSQPRWDRDLLALAANYVTASAAYLLFAQLLFGAR